MRTRITPNTDNLYAVNLFKKELLKSIRSKPNLSSNIRNTEELKLLKRLRLGLSHLGNHKFRHNFQNYVCPMRTSGQGIETKKHL